MTVVPSREDAERTRGVEGFFGIQENEPTADGRRVDGHPDKEIAVAFPAPNQLQRGPTNASRS